MNGFEEVLREEEKTVWAIKMVKYIIPSSPGEADARTPIQEYG